MSKHELYYKSLVVKFHIKSPRLNSVKASVVSMFWLDLLRLLVRGGDSTEFFVSILRGEGDLSPRHVESKKVIGFTAHTDENYLMLIATPSDGGSALIYELCLKRKSV